MNIRQLKSRALITAAAAAAVYSAVTGKGFFNKPRFREQHEALGKYMENNYPGCTYSPISIHGRGWSSCVRRMGIPVCYLYFSKSEDGTYVFTESKHTL
ncbi:MAG: hypothetical protein IJH37_11085 [Clostridia bacterium]|nr:hypothetical protein [Clostridia bacterium]